MDCEHPATTGLIVLLRHLWCISLLYALPSPSRLGASPWVRRFRRVVLVIYNSGQHSLHIWRHNVWPVPVQSAAGVEVAAVRSFQHLSPSCQLTGIPAVTVLRRTSFQLANLLLSRPMSTAQRPRNGSRQSRTPTMATIGGTLTSTMNMVQTNRRLLHIQLP